jgi:hypothetical protein
MTANIVIGPLPLILADAINLGIAKMAEACPGTTLFFAADSNMLTRRSKRCI